MKDGVINSIMPNKIRMKKAPSYKLGAFCFCLFLIYISLLCWKLFPIFNEYSWIGIVPKNYLTGKWVSTISIAFIPAIGWLFSGYISVRNLTKQHSMNILLQTRTSAEYVKHAIVAQKYINEEHLEISEDDKNSIIYILNFLEFVSIGIISGELDENIFKQAWKNTFKLTNEIHKDTIIYHQKKIPSIWSNFVWINERWQSERAIWFPKNRMLKELYITLIIVCSTIIFCFFSVLIFSGIVYLFQ